MAASSAHRALRSAAPAARSAAEVAIRIGAHGFLGTGVRPSGAARGCFPDGRPSHPYAMDQAAGFRCLRPGRTSTRGLLPLPHRHVLAMKGLAVDLAGEVADRPAEVTPGSEPTDQRVQLRVPSAPSRDAAISLGPIMKGLAEILAQERGHRWSQDHEPAPQRSVNGGTEQRETQCE